MYNTYILLDIKMVTISFNIILQNDVSVDIRDKGA